MVDILRSTGSSILTVDSDAQAPAGSVYIVRNLAPTAPVISGVAGDTLITIIVDSAATDVEDGTVNLYNVYVDGVLHAQDVTILQGASYDVTGLTNGTEYDITLKAKDSAEALSDASNTVTATPATGITAFIDPSFETMDFTGDMTIGWLAQNSANSTINIISPTGGQTPPDGAKAVKIVTTGDGASSQNSAFLQEIPSSKKDLLANFACSFHIISAESTAKASIPYNNGNKAYVRLEVYAYDALDANITNTADGNHIIYFYGYGGSGAFGTYNTDINFDAWIRKAFDLKAHITNILNSGKTWADVDHIEFRCRSGMINYAGTFSVLFDLFEG